MITPKRTSMFTLRLLASSCMMLSALTGSAQQPKRIIPEKTDTIATFRGVAVSADLVGLGQLVLSDYGQLEAALRVNIKDKYFPVVELGLGRANADDVTTRLTYKATAPYGKAGLDFNMMRNKHDDYRLYLGFRYACTSFKYDIEHPGITDPVWGGVHNFGAQGVKGSYHWLEGVAGIDAKIWGAFRLGWSVRYKRRLFHTAGEIGEPWYVPGFGRAGGAKFGATFNVILEI